MSWIPSTRVNKIPNSDSITLTHVHSPRKIILGYGNQVFHIIQYIYQFFFTPPKLPNSPPSPITPQLSHTPPKLHPLLQLKTHYLINFSDDINHLIHHFTILYIDGAPKNNICIKTTKILIGLISALQLQIINQLKKHLFPLLPISI